MIFQLKKSIKLQALTMDVSSACYLWDWIITSRKKQKGQNSKFRTKIIENTLLKPLKL